MASSPRTDQHTEPTREQLDWDSAVRNRIKEQERYYFVRSEILEAVMEGDLDKAALFRNANKSRRTDAARRLEIAQLEAEDAGIDTRLGMRKCEVQLAMVDRGEWRSAQAALDHRFDLNAELAASVAKATDSRDFGRARVLQDRIDTGTSAIYSFFRQAEADAAAAGLDPYLGKLTGNTADDKTFREAARHAKPSISLGLD